MCIFLGYAATRWRILLWNIQISAFYSLREIWMFPNKENVISKKINVSNLAFLACSSLKNHRHKLNNNF